jgi:hypothetical protein
MPGRNRKRRRKHQRLMRVRRASEEAATGGQEEPPPPSSDPSASSVESLGPMTAPQVPSDPAGDDSDVKTAASHSSSAQSGGTSAQGDELGAWWEDVTKKDLGDMRDMISTRNTGRFITHLEEKLIVATLLRKMGLHKEKSTKKKSLDAIVKAHANDFGMGPGTLRTLLHRFVIEGEGKRLPIRKRKKRTAQETIDEITITEEHEKEIRKFVKGRCELGQGTKLPAICRHLRQTFEEEGKAFPTWVVQYHLKNHMGWEYQKLNAVSYDLNSEKAKKQFLDYAYRLDYYLKLESQGKAKCVYLDETYLNEGHHDPWGWMDPMDRSQYTLKIKHKGRRIIAIDAITIDGRLTDSDCTKEQELLEIIRTPNKKLPSADAVFETGLLVWSQNEATSDISDYHKTMDSDMFCKYIENRVYPAFKKKYPDRRMILVMDNAKYHHALCSDAKEATMTKPAAAVYLRKHGVGSIKVSMNRRKLKLAKDKRGRVRRKAIKAAKDAAQAEGVEFVSPVFPPDPEPAENERPLAEGDEVREILADDWGKEPSRGGAYAWELQAAVSKLWKEKPYLRKYKLWETLKKLSRAEGKHEYYHFVIFTPPYRCRCQPTEVQWNFVKVKAAEELTNESTYRDILAAWVVGTLEVKDQFCTNWVKKSTKYCTDTYQTFMDDTTAVIGELEVNPWEEPVPHSGEDVKAGGEQAGEVALDVSGDAPADNTHEDVDGDGTENATNVSDLVEHGIAGVDFPVDD